MHSHIMEETCTGNALDAFIAVLSRCQRQENERANWEADPTAVFHSDEYLVTSKCESGKKYGDGKE